MADDPIRILAPPASAQRLGSRPDPAPAARHGRRGPRGPRRRAWSARGVRRRRQRRKRGRDEWPGDLRWRRRQRHPEPLHVGRVPLAGAARQVRQRDRHVYNSNEEAIAKLQAVGRHERLRHHRPDRRLHPADGGRRPLEALDTSKLPNFGNIDPLYTRPVVGSRQLVLGAEGLGLDRLDLRQHRDHRRRSRPGATSSAAAEGPASGQTSVLDTAPNVTRSSTSGPTASTGRRRSEGARRV